MSGPHCDNCGMVPTDHKIIQERLVCRTDKRQEWKWTKEDRLIQISGRLGDIEAERIRLTKERDTLLAG